MPDNGHHAPAADASRLSKLNVPAELHQRARAAVRIVRRVTGRRYTIAQFVTEAFVAQLAVIARDYNGGREIYPDTEPLERGRG
ncbi:MAG: 50S ribosomal protein L7ae [Mycobacterium sp.]|nr:50S ribosomal protein L7ae [Mycobacterium sp.]